MGEPKLQVDISTSAKILGAVVENIKKVIVGKDQQIRDILCAWIAGGHVLIEDIPGTGKTMLVRALAKSAKVTFKRVQFTPDLLPSDILGASIYNQKELTFDFRPGPIFTTILLADEINRATPRTQSALLEGMSEQQVSIEGTTRPLDPLFFTIATQNPVDQLGTFALPEAQMDRFMIRIGMGYPDLKQEVQIAKNQNRQHPIESTKGVVDQRHLEWLVQQVPMISVSEEVYTYAAELIHQSRKQPEVKLGASPRGTIALIRMAQALAMYEGSDYVMPKHIQQMAKPVIAHRLILTAEAKMAGTQCESIVDTIINFTPVPVKDS